MKNILLFLFSFLVFCNLSYSQNSLICTSNKALELIVKEIVGTRVKVSSLVKDGKQVGNLKNVSESARVYIYSSEAETNYKIKFKINASDLMGKEALSTNDSMQNKNKNPFFWIDPISLKLVCAKLTDSLKRIFPEYSQDFQVNLESFNSKLDLLYLQSMKLLPNANGKRIISLTKGFEYFTNRYGIEIMYCFNRNSNFKLDGNKQIETLVNKMDKEMVNLVGLETNLEPIDKEISFALKTNLFYLDIYGKDNQKKYSDFFLTLVRRMQRILN